MSDFQRLAVRHFSDFWFECPALPDGSRVLLRPVGPGDLPLVRESGLALPPDEGGDDGVVLGAFSSQPRALVGLGGFVRDARDGARLNLAVAGSFQRRGLGALLLARLRLIALERGITRFTADVLNDNEPVLNLLRKLDAHIGVRWMGLRSVELPLS